jgi:hypothetical protein
MRPEKPCLRAKKYFIAALGVTLVCATSAWAAREKILHNFVNLLHGANPQANVIAVSAGNLYGTTYNGGEHGFGGSLRCHKGRTVCGPRESFIVSSAAPMEVTQPVG